jgi:hypothetical protein
MHTALKTFSGRACPSDIASQEDIILLSPSQQAQRDVHGSSMYAVSALLFAYIPLASSSRSLTTCSVDVCSSFLFVFFARF